MADNFLDKIEKSFTEGIKEYAKPLNFMFIQADKEREAERQRKAQSIAVEEIVVEPQNQNEIIAQVVDNEDLNINKDDGVR